VARYIVTGGAGFIGSHLCELLLAGGDEVVAIDNFASGRENNLADARRSPRFTFRELDVAAAMEPLAEAFAHADGVFHLAGLADIVPSIERPAAYERANVHGTFTVCEAARAAGVRKIVYAASSSCYGIPALYPTPETAPTSPEYPYALTKELGERIAIHWGKVYGLEAISLRLFNVYGPRARTGGTYGAVFGVFLAQKRAGKPLTVVGDGCQTRDFTYVTDVAAAFAAAMRSGLRGEILNVGSGTTVAVNRLVELLGGDFEGRLRVVHIPKRPGEPDVTFADVSKIERLLGWRAQVTIDDGVARMLERIDDWRDAPVWEPTSIARATAGWFAHLGPAPV
jgi:UDP-glucose 4-epimerase